jgi:pyroglutamyl-peptidase
MTTILITGFGPFPGAPYNPTTPLVARLARLRRPALANVKVVAHVFPTSYAAVDRELPRLIASHKPDVLLMFGLAGRTRAIRIEARARNALALMPDVGGATPRGRSIAAGLPAQVLPAPTRHLLGAARAARVPVVLSRDAGQYLCNYLCWHAARSARTAGVPRLAAFVHVPPTRRHARPRGKGRPRLTFADITRAGGRLLVALAAAARR